MSTAARPGKRRREQDRLERLRQYGVDLPDIRGLPVQLVPLQVHALRTATALFRTAAAGPVRLSPPASGVLADVEETSQSAHGSAADSRDVLGDIFGRIDRQRREPAEARRRVLSPSRDPPQDLKHALDAWLEAVRRFHRDSSRGQQGPPSSAPVSIPLAAFRHLWPIAMNQDGDSSVASQRAALHLCGNLLCKSSDCRQWLLDANGHLSAWVEHTAQPPSTGTRPPSQTSDQWTSFQQESYSILEHLVHLGYQELYPTLAVALQRLQQSASLDGAAPAPSRMAAGRRARDAALRHHERDVPRVQRLLRRAQAAMEVLVPRFSAGPGHRHSFLSVEAPGSDGIVDSSGDEEDSLLDWEDGCAEDTHKGSKRVDQPDLPWDETGFGQTEPHEAAVERTLRTMQATAAMQNGAIEIQLGAQSTPEASSEETDASTRRARQDLKECIHQLTRRHMPRLSAWVEGLTNADSLVQATTETDSSSYVSLVSMPRALLDRRAEATRRLQDIKQDVAAVLASAKKLGVYLDEQEATAHVARPDSSGRLGTGWASASTSRPPPRIASQGLRTRPQNTTRRRISIKLGR